MAENTGDIEIKILDEPPKNGPKLEASEKETDIIRITDQDLMKDPGESVIKISEADLTPLPPDININYRDVARNPFEWLAGASKDLLAMAKKMKTDIRWWGGGERGKQKLSQYQAVEKERADIERLVEQIVILPDETKQNWRNMTDKDLGDIEIKSIEKSVGPEPNNGIVITEADLTVAPDKISSRDQERENREFWTNYKREQEEFFSAQSAAISATYADRELQTPICMDKHHRQEHLGQDGIYTCSIASTLNALYALRAARSDDNEDTLIRAVGGREPFLEHDGYLPMLKVYDVLKDRGLVVRDSGNMLELLQTLENGGVALIAYGGHARMISGAEKKDDQVHLRVNDPLKDEVTIIPVTEMMRQINQIPQFYNLFLVENPPQTSS